jgi:hypothetical protein
MKKKKKTGHDFIHTHTDTHTHAENAKEKNECAHKKMKN